MDKPLIVIFSDPNFLTLSLVENLLTKPTRLVIFSSEKKLWLEKISHIKQNSNLVVYDEKDVFDFSSINYAVFINGITDKKNCYLKFKRIYQNPIFTNIKTLAVFPSETFDLKESSALPLNGNLAVVYVGDLLGPRIDLNADSHVNEHIRDAIQNREIEFGIGEVFYPTFVPDLAKNLSQWIFSFGPYGKEVFLLGNQVSGSTFWGELKKFIPDLIVSFENKELLRVIPRGFDTKYINTNLTLSLKESFNWISNIAYKPKKEVKVKQPLVPKIVKPEKIIPKVNPDFKKLRKLKIGLSIILPILLLPYILLTIILGLFFFSYKTYLNGNSGLSRSLLLLSKTPSAIGKAESNLLRRIPLLGIIYKESYFALSASNEISDIGVSGIYLLDNARIIFDKSLSNEVYDPEVASSEIKIQLDSLYKYIANLEIETNEASKQQSLIAKEVLRRIDFEKLKRLTLDGSKIVNNLPSILGKDERKTYLVLFQNNMELRPTGGFIGSFGLLTFEGGRMSDFTLSDVYSADGQLKGHIEPPTPIKEYLGEANWFLRDSNWDPDFPTSARRAEWFLDKEIDRKVDGVFALDLEPVKSMVTHTGPIYLADYEMDITKDNLYEKTQEEVHEEVFVGTHKKASFLTALSRNLVTEVSNLPSGKKVQILKEFYKDLEERHIQLFLHSEETQSAISNLGWSGEVATPYCGKDCYPDFLSVIEANVGVNKANYFISRSYSLDVEVTPEKITRNLTLTIKNSANPGLGLVGKYKAYIRLLVPNDSIVDGPFDVSEAKGKKEIGFLTEIVGGETKEISLSWASPNSSSNSYGVYFRKQAGTPENEPLKVSILAPDKAYSYNTTLDKDFLTKISWINTH